MNQVQTIVAYSSLQLTILSSAAPDEDTAKWEAELNQLMQAQREELELEYGQSMREAWESGMGQYDGDTLPDPMKFDDEGVPILDAYTFGKSLDCVALMV